VPCAPAQCFVRISQNTIDDTRIPNSPRYLSRSNFEVNPIPPLKQGYYSSTPRANLARSRASERASEARARAQLISCSCLWGNNSPAPGRARGHSHFITRSTNVTAVRLSVMLSQPLITLTKRAHRSRPPRLLQEEHGCLEPGACSL